MPSLIFGGVFAGLDVMQGAHWRNVLNPRVLGSYVGGIYAYNVMTCPMEAIHGRQSLLHNFLSAGVIGYAGVNSGKLGIPFIQNPYQYGSNPATVAFVVYGSIATAFAAFGGKRL